MQLSNLSVRTTLAAAQALTVGFTVGGHGGSRWILVRAAGPSLTVLGVPNAMADPKIELHARGRRVAENDNWGDGPAVGVFSQVGAFPFATGSRDAAWIGPLVGGVSAVAYGTSPGAILVECCDASLAPTFAGAGAFPFPPGSRDAALVATVTAPAAYTVRVSGVGGAVGEALVELYELP